ncbi:unnamed protein product [Prunus armeniaca]
MFQKKEILREGGLHLCQGGSPRSEIPRALTKSLRYVLKILLLTLRRMLQITRRSPIHFMGLGPGVVMPEVEERLLREGVPQGRGMKLVRLVFLAASVTSTITCC